MVEKQSEFKIKKLRSDRGGEYIGHEFESFVKDNGIHHQLTASFTPQQNGWQKEKTGH